VQARSASATTSAGMLKNVKDPKDLKDILLSVLGTSGTMAGLSMALVGIINLRAANTSTETIADDLFLFSSAGFLIVCYLVFFALRRLSKPNIRTWTAMIDVLFLTSMTVLVLSGFVVLYAFGFGYGH
jgi:nitrate reductase gamma subunit